MPEQSILGPEAPLWSETLEDIDDIEFMAFPRMAGIAEIGWSRRTAVLGGVPAAARAQGPRWDDMSVNYYRSPEVDWP